MSRRYPQHRHRRRRRRARSSPSSGPFVYINFIKDDPPERLSLDDVPRPRPATTARTTDRGAADGIEGTWTVADGSIVGYRIDETLFGQNAEAVGRSEGVTGDVTIEGTTVTDGDLRGGHGHLRERRVPARRAVRGPHHGGRRVPDRHLRAHRADRAGRGAGRRRGRSPPTATGDLTLHGVTREVTIDLVARLDGSTFAVDGSTTVTFSDYDIDDPSGGPASVGDDGELEVLLVFSR